MTPREEFHLTLVLETESGCCDMSASGDKESEAAAGMSNGGWVDLGSQGDDRSGEHSDMRSFFVFTTIALHSGRTWCFRTDKKFTHILPNWGERGLICVPFSAVGYYLKSCCILELYYSTI